MEEFDPEDGYSKWVRSLGDDGNEGGGGLEELMERFRRERRRMRMGESSSKRG